MTKSLSLLPISVTLMSALIMTSTACASPAQQTANLPTSGQPASGQSGQEQAPTLRSASSDPVQTVQLQPVANQAGILSDDTARAQRFASWKADFIRRAIDKGYNPDLVRGLIQPAVINEKAIERNESQPEFSRPIWEYVDNAANATRLNGGRNKLGEERAVFDAVENRYFVDRNILTAIWGLESAYGSIMGTHEIVSALSTFAFEGRRQKFGEQQLFGVLDMVSAGYVRPEQLVGSWAGAMGMMQFIPTTFRDYAVDFDGNGNRDLWTSSEDALGSAAHYLSRHGWQWNEPVFIEVQLPQGFDYSWADGRKRRVSDWSVAGVMPLGGERWAPAANTLEGKLLVPAGHRGPKFLTFKNFDVIKRYNNSTSYALGITTLAEALGGKSAIRTAWPRDDEPISRTDKEALQRRLTALGFDTKGVDGQIGPNTRKAIRAWQQANGTVADGYVEKALFQRIMGY